MAAVRQYRAQLVASVLLAAVGFAPLLAVGQDLPASDCDCDAVCNSLWRVRGEYLLWWSNGNHLPPLITTSPDGTPRSQAGVLGTSGVTTLLGDGTIDTGARSGGRLTLSRWFDETQLQAFEFVGFYVGDDVQSGNFTRQSTGSPILARPFFNIGTGQEDAGLIAFPNVFAGSVTATSYSEVYSAAALLRNNIGMGPLGRVDVLGGYRYFRLRETLAIREHVVSTDPGGLVPLGTTSDLVDRFATGNDFHGAEVGLSSLFSCSRCSVELLAKVAIGGAFRKVAISGSTTTTLPNNPSTTTPGGLLALPSNIGSYPEAAFGVLPEFGLNTTWAMSPNTTLVFGYTLIAFNDVLRTGDQIDRVVNTSQIGGRQLVGPARPQFTFDHSNFVLQGLNFGADYRW
jgi:hypothetical protein